MPDPLNMASSGKKGKKAKGKTISLNSFLQETPGNVVLLRHAPLNWADEVEDTYDSYDGGRSSAKSANVVLPTAPKAARGLDDFSHKIPSQPPYNVYLSNLPYDVEEDEIAEFFEDLKIVSMRIPREDRAGEAPRVKGFGYVEFEDQESLIEALEKPSCILKGRRIRIEIATNSDSDKRRGRMDMNRDRADRPEAPTGDWRSLGRQEPEGPSEWRFGRDGGGRDFNRGGEERSGGMWRDGDRPSFRDRDSDRDRGGFSREPREDKPITRDAPPRYDSTERRGFGVRRERDDRPIERSDRMERGDRRPDDRYMDRGERNGGLRRDDDEPRKERPKLNLAPRSVPVATNAALAPPEREAGSGGDEKSEPKVPAASIFGSAKPVDTTAREREIEERLAKVEVDARDDRRDDRRRDERRHRSPERRRYSPRRGDSPDRRDSPPRRRSPEIRRASPDRRRSPEIRRGSPDRRRGSPDHRRGDDRRPVRGDRSDGRDRERNSSQENRDYGRQGREYTYEDMPKVKAEEPLPIIGQNKYAYLSDEGED